MQVQANPLTLVVAINKDTKGVTLNNEPYGDVTDTQKLIDKLREVFKQRADAGVLNENTNQVERTLFVKAPKSVRYGDVVQVIDAVKQAGASPIGLQIDDLAN